MGFVPACFEVVLYIRKETFQSGGFDGIKCLTIDPSRTAVPLGYMVGLLEGLRPCHMDEDAPEAMCLFRLRLPIYPPSQLLQRNGCLCHLTLASLGQTELSSVRALPSGCVLLHAHRRCKSGEVELSPCLRPLAQTARAVFPQAAFLCGRHCGVDDGLMPGTR